MLAIVLLDTKPEKVHLTETRLFGHVFTENDHNQTLITNADLRASIFWQAVCNAEYRMVSWDRSRATNTVQGILHYTVLANTVVLIIAFRFWQTLVISTYILKTIDEIYIPARCTRAWRLPEDKIALKTETSGQYIIRKAYINHRNNNCQGSLNEYNHGNSVYMWSAGNNFFGMTSLYWYTGRSFHYWSRKCLTAV